MCNSKLPTGSVLTPSPSHTLPLPLHVFLTLPSPSLLHISLSLSLSLLPHSFMSLSFTVTLLPHSFLSLSFTVTLSPPSLLHVSLFHCHSPPSLLLVSLFHCHSLSSLTVQVIVLLLLYLWEPPPLISQHWGPTGTTYVREAMRHPFSVKCCTCGPDACMQCHCHMLLDRMCGREYVCMYVDVRMCVGVGSIFCPVSGP